MIPSIPEFAADNRRIWRTRKDYVRILVSMWGDACARATMLRERRFWGISAPEIETAIAGAHADTAAELAAWRAAWALEDAAEN